MHKFIRRVKSEYFENKFNKCIDDISGIWKNIYKQLNKKMDVFPDEFKIKSSKVSNSKLISDAFDNIFCDALVKLINNKDRYFINTFVS